MSVRLLFSFDSEDYETPASDDAELWWAELLARHGAPANVCLVTEEARALARRGRRDVLAAWARHEIASHTDLHSAHPTPAEYLDDLAALDREGAFGPAAGRGAALARLGPWDGGVLAFAAQEGPGIAELAELFGRRPAAWCKPGNSWGPQLCAALPRLGVPVFADAPLEWAAGQPLLYDGVLMLRYHASFDRYFARPEERAARMRADFEALMDRHRAAARDAARLDPHGRTPDAWIVLYTHPCRLLTAEFPRNFEAGRNPPRDAWQPARLRPPEEVAALRRDCAAFVRWLVAESGAEPATYSGVAAAYRHRAVWLTQTDLAALCAAPNEDAELLGLDPDRAVPRRAGRTWLSPAEQLGVLAFAAARHETPPVEVLARPLLGPREAPLSSGPHRASREALVAAARWTDIYCHEHGAVPAAVPVGQGAVGPRALLVGLRALLGDLVRDEVDLPADPGEVAFARRPDAAGLRYQATWSIFPAEFQGERLLELHRAQCWTVKPALPTR
ncbi:MAG TPA: hypothetical protein VG370_09620 [Chloroflexota bacterium]|nr:hypothetical protein [Chloroflexota bacterium]